MAESLTIWCNAKFGADAQRLLESGLGPHRLLLSRRLQESNLASTDPDPTVQAADVALGQPYPDDVIASRSLRWIHLTSASYARYDRDDLKHEIRARGAMLTNSSQVYADPCAQHLLAFMLSGARRLSEAQADQIAHRGWTYLALRQRCAVLSGQTALIVGFGSIGRRLAELLAPFRMKVIGVRRSPREDEPIHVIA